MGRKVENKHKDKIDKMVDEHLQYEVQNFIFCTNYLLQIPLLEICIENFKHDYPQEANFKELLNGLILENWVMGLRKLYDFLYKTSKKCDNDWFIADTCFSEANYWNEFFICKNLIDDDLKKYIVRVHKMSAHISFGRIEDKKNHDYGWEINFAEPILNGLNVFFEEIVRNPNSHYTKGIKYQVENMENGLLTLKSTFVSPSQKTKPY